MPAHDVEITANSLEYKCSSGERKKDSSKGYICVGGNGVGVISEDCNCTSGGLHCVDERPGYYYPPWGNGYAYPAPWCAAYESYPPSCQKCYKCKPGWNNYSGSGENLKCYVNATM